MRFTWKTLAALLCSAFGILSWCYLGGWMVLTGPVKGVITAYFIGNLSLGKLVGAVIEGYIYLSLAGGTWCLGYMMSNYFQDH